MSSSDPLAVLPVAERNELERFLMEFDQEWSAQSLGLFWDRLSSEKSGEVLQSAAAELVKIDLRRGWAAGRGRLLEDYCEQIPVLGDAQTIDVDLILAEFDARRAAGANVTKESYQGRFRDQYHRFAKLADRSDDSSGVRVSPPRSQASLDTSRVSSARDTNPDGITSPIELPAEFDRYRLVKELGSGAMGMVYLAHDTQLDRQVALKTPTFKRDKQEELVSRFYREARTAAKIQHRNICPIYDVGEIDGQHFISMGFVRGRRLSEYISADKLPPAKTSAILVHRLALALAEAHRHNIVHRDLKPANIMIDVKREPVVLDFGLARDTESETQITKSGMVVGTPAYMSPEQIRGDSNEAGPSSDIYALGVVLYELLTGRLPFAGSVTQVIYKVTSESPPPPSEIRSEIPPELEAICAKMMAKTPEQRYESMDEAALDLKRFLKGKQPAASQAAGAEVTGGPPADRAEEDSTSEVGKIGETGVLNAFFAEQAAGDPRQTSVEPSVPGQRQEHASRVGVPLKAISRRISRPPAWTKWTAAALAPVLILAAVVMTFRVGDKQVRLEIGPQLAESEELEVFLDGNQLSIAGVGETIELDIGEHRWEIRRGDQVIQGPEQYVVNHGENEVLRLEVNDLPAASDPALGPEGIVSDDARGKKTSELPPEAAIARTPLPDGPPEEVIVLEGHEKKVSDLAISPDGTRLLSASGYQGDHSVRLWDLEIGRQLLKFPAYTDTVDFSPDGKLVAHGTGKLAHGPRKHTIVVRRLFDGQVVQTLTGHTGDRELRTVDFSPDGRRLVSCGHETVWVWDVESGEEIRQWELKAARSAQFSPDGRLVLDNSFGNGAAMRVWDVETGEQVREFDHGTGWSEGAISPDGRLLLVGSYGSKAQLIDFQTGELLAHFDGHTKAIGAVAFSPDGRFAVTGSDDTTVRVWDPESKQQVALFEGHTDAITALEVTPDSRFAISGSADATLRIWRLPMEVSGTEDRRDAPNIKLVEVNRHEYPAAELFRNDTDWSQFQGLATSNQGKLLAYNNWTGSGTVLYDVVKGARLWRSRHSGTCVRFSQDHQRLWTSWCEVLHALSIDDGSSLNHEVPEQGSQRGCATACNFFPDEKRLVVLYGEDPPSGVLWDVDSSEMLSKFDLPSRGGGCAVSPDNRTVLIGLKESAPQIWQRQDKQLIHLKTLEGYLGQSSYSVDFSPNGALASTSGNVTQVWDTETWTEVCSFPVRSGTVSFINDKYLLCSHEGYLALWDIDTQRVVVQQALRVRNPLNEHHILTVSTDKKWFVTLGRQTEANDMCIMQRWKLEGVDEEPDPSQANVPRTPLPQVAVQPWTETDQGSLSDPYAADRQVAEWVLSAGGSLKIEDWQVVDRIEDLPQSTFKILQVTLTQSENVTDDDFRDLPGLPDLSKFYIKAKATGPEMIRWLSHCPRLGTVDIQWSPHVNTSDLTPLKKLPGLVHLRISPHQIDDDWTFLEEIPSLLRLDISVTYGFPDLPKDPGLLKNLHTLHFMGAETLEPKYAEELRSANPDLRLLIKYAPSVVFGKDHVLSAAKKIADAGGQVKVSGADLEGWSDWINDLSNVTRPHVQAIRFGQGTEMSPEVVSGLVQVSNGLAFVDAPGAQNCDGLVRGMSERPFRVAWLILIESDLSDAGLELLLEWNFLDELNVRGTAVTEAAVLRFHKHVPNCRIHSDFGTFQPQHILPPGWSAD